LEKSILDLRLCWVSSIFIFCFLGHCKCT